MFHGVFEIPALQSRLLQHGPLIMLLELARSPQVLTPAILGVLIVYFCRGQAVRQGLIGLSVTLLLLFSGVPFAIGILCACGLVFCLARLLLKWQQLRPQSPLPMTASWLVTNSLLLPCFFVTLPTFDGYMEWGELTQFWGVGFLSLRALHYQGQVLRGAIDPLAAGSFSRYLHYMIHAPSFTFGPYQTYRQFTHEVDTCRDRLGWESFRYGAWRIALGLAKMALLLEFIQKKIFYARGYYGPFATGLFENLDAHTTPQLWMYALLIVARMYLFISSVSDGVIGMNWMMGIRVPENFQKPFLATNVIDFWRRWHCGVGTFLRDEIFIPVGGAEHRLRGYLLTFLYCGFWHFPFLGALVLFPVFQTTAFLLTHAWIDSWRSLKKARPQWHALARRLQLVDSLPARLTGIAATLLIFLVSCLFVFDHKTSGLPMLGRLFGLQSRAMPSARIASHPSWSHRGPTKSNPGAIQP